MIRNSLRNICIIFLLSSVISYSIAFADADRVFKENSKTVVIVLTYDEKGELIGQGSGFIVRADGAVVTNYHCISNAKDIKIKSGDKTLDVEGLIYTNKENDLVILKSKGEKLPVVKLGDIGKTNVGEKVYVISSPKGLENTISDGILSGIREITPEKKILQITAPVSPGSSGGPVFNKNGEVIGIATLIVEEAQNLNFAMPVNLIKDKINIIKVTALKDAGIEDYKKTAEYWFICGCNFGEAGLYKEAIEACKQAIRIKPDYAEAHACLGLVYLKLGMYKESIEANKQAIRIKTDYAEVLLGLGVAYVELGMYKEAVDVLRQAITLKPDIAADTYLVISNIYYECGMYSDSIESCKRAIRIKPDFAEAYCSLGITYGKLDMYKDAMEAYKQSIKIKPDFANAHVHLGLTYSRLGMNKEAIEALKQAIRIKPDFAEAHACLGLVYVKLGNKGMALEEYKILKNINSELAEELFNKIYK